MNNLILYSEFAALAGIKSNALSVYVKRNKVVIAQTIGEGKEKQVLIDPENSVNKTFLKERALLNAKKAYENKEIGNSSPATTIDNETLKINSSVKENKEDSYWSQTKRAEMEFKQSRAEMAKIELEQKREKLIPLDIVLSTALTWAQEYKMNFFNSVDLLIRDLCNEHGISNEDRVKSYSKLIDISNESTNIAYNNISKSLKTITDKQKEQL
jgi:hypothetical protein